MFKWKRLGRVFKPNNTNSPEWMHSFAQSPTAIILEDRVRVFFCSRPKPNETGSYLSYIGFIDLNKTNPLDVLKVSHQPLLELGNTGTFDEFGTNPVSAILLEDKSIYLYYAGWTRCESVPINGAIGFAKAKSPNDKFMRLGEGPVIPYSLQEPFMMGSPRIKKFRNTFYLFYVAGKRWLESPEGKLEPIYKIRMASSPDGINWTKANVDLIESLTGENECQACPDVTFANGKYHMFFSYRNYYDYKSVNGGYKIGYASSSNLNTWQRDDKKANFHPNSDIESWDNEMVSYSNIIQIDNRTLMFYQGNQMGLEGFGVCQLEGELC